MLIDFAVVTSRGPTEESERLLSQGLLSAHVSGENNCRPRRSGDYAAVRFRDRKRSISRLRRNSAGLSRGVPAKISCLFH
ncbi:ADM_collapsed_G0016620.mRNA.1.CDS.1 [Saccharomyces cerevisiae]|nr:ADM_collapsed_G0016620.mRNA.1.CDS.1 [Saccharomyces cerevisiae]